MKAVLISIKPKWCELIAQGKKTVEVRKTKPKIDVPFKCYIYCTKAKDYFSIGGGVYATNDELYRLPTGEIKFGDSFELMGDWRGQYDENNFLNGKVIGYFICDRIVEFENDCYEPTFAETADLSCVGFEGLCDYLGAKEKGYGWHITDLVIYDKPKELSEFYVEGDCDCLNCKKCYWFDKGNGFNVEDDCNLAYKGMAEHKSYKPIIRPPQSWCYVEELGV